MNQHQFEAHEQACQHCGRLWIDEQNCGVTECKGDAAEPELLSGDALWESIVQASRSQ